MSDQNRDSKDQLSILVFCDDNPGHAAMILDHIEAIASLSRHRVYIINSVYQSGDDSLDLNEFDVVVLHYSLFVIMDCYLSKAYRQKIRDFKGLKIQFIQDDYRGVDALTAEIRFMGIDILYTLVPDSEHHRIWHSRLPGVQLKTWIAGYIPDRLVGQPTIPMKDRPIDVGYRGRTMPYWLGSLAYEKILVGQGFLDRAVNTNLKCDISWKEEHRIYGAAWDNFNKSCRAMLGCGSGATIADFDGSAERAVRTYLETHPDADYPEVAQAVLTPFEGNINLNVISPRQFEAIAARTALVLFPGDYSGILQPWEHYLPLEKDFSNFDEIAAKIQDVPFLEAMTERAYQEVIASKKYSYHEFVRDFDSLVFTNRKPSHEALTSKSRYYRTRMVHYFSFKAWRQKIAFQIATNQPVKLNMRFGKRKTIVTFPCLALQVKLYRFLQKSNHALRGARHQLGRVKRAILGRRATPVVDKH